MVIKQEVYGSFDPFEMDAFYCPVCEGKTVVELKPYGGVWCKTCNALFKVSFTCDGPRKLAVKCITKDCWKKEHRGKNYGTVIWSSDEKIGWITLE